MARQLLEQVYARFAQLPEVKHITLPRTAFAMIAMDALSPGPARKGSMIYKEAIVLPLPKESWAIAFGTRCNGHLSAPYDCDILAFRLLFPERPEEVLGQDIREYIVREANCFNHSLIYAMAGGQLAVSQDAHFARAVCRTLGQTSMYVLRGVEMNSDLIEVATELPLITASMLYDPTFVPFLFEGLLEALRAGVQVGTRGYVLT